jgi:inosine-uridine nucleoside N-ribohydrolase
MAKSKVPLSGHPSYRLPDKLIGLFSRLSSPLTGSRPRDILLSTDCGAGFDSYLVAAYIALSPNFNLKAIVTSQAPNVTVPPASTTSANAVWLMRALAVKSRPHIVAGSNNRLPDIKGDDTSGAEFIAAMANDYGPQNRLTVVLAGPATDIACALELDPLLSSRIEIVAAGFEKFPEGGDMWNVRNDVWAWEILLDSEVPLIVGDASVAGEHLLLNKDDLLARLPGRAGRPLVWQVNNGLNHGSQPGTATTGSALPYRLHDLVTIAYLSGLTDWQDIPRPLLKDDITLSASEPFIPNGNAIDNPADMVRWITAVDGEALWQDIEAVLNDANEASLQWFPFGR